MPFLSGYFRWGFLILKKYNMKQIIKTKEFAMGFFFGELLIFITYLLMQILF